MIFQRLIAGGGGTSGTGTGGNPVVSGAVNVSGELVLTLQDGSSVNCGVVFDGTGNPVTSGTVNGAGELILTLDDGTQINAGVVTQDLTAELAKLASIEAGATANSADAELRDRSTHTGTQPIGSVDGLQAGLDAKVDKVAGKQLSTEDYTTAEKDKLAGLESGGSLNQAEFPGVLSGTGVSVAASAVVAVLAKEGTDSVSNDIVFSASEADYAQEGGTEISGGVVSLASAGDSTVDSHDVFGDGSALATYQLNGDVLDLGGSYHGTATNVSYAGGLIGQAADFDAGVSVVSGLPTSGLSEITISLWVNLSGSGRQTIISAGDGTDIMIDDYEGGRIRLNLGGSDVDLPFTNSFNTAGVWRHVLVTYDGAEIRAYLDNAPNGSIAATGALGPYSDEFYIGSRAGGYNASGLIDQVRVFNRAVTPAEVEALYNEGQSGYPTSQPYYVYHSASVDVSGYSVINGYQESSTEPAGTSIKRLVSFDGGTSWMRWDGSGFMASSLDDLQTGGNTLAELQVAFSGFDVTGVSSISIAYDLASTDASVTPSVDFNGTGFNADSSQFYVQLTPAIDYDVVQSVATGEQTQTVTNKTGSTKDLLINYV